MRGYGTIFGTEQSGAKDVGLDLQAAILRNAVDSLKQELVIAVPECRVQLELPIETMFCSSIGQMPHSSDLNEIARWEGQLTEQILQKFGVEIIRSRDKSSRSTNSSPTSNPSPPPGGEVKVDNLLREYLSAGTSEKLIALVAKWEKKYSNVNVVYNLNANMYSYVRADSQLNSRVG